ncbi:MAG: hypothetical protein H0T84_06880, partial [Tatlockia sp.]|nr:hypothetical protein [Tatlockia sp.]
MNSGYIPVITTQAGFCLTMENWQEIGVSTAAYYLDSLLMKPGYTVLKSLPSLQSYCGWSGTIVLNASFAAANSEGIYSFRSLYDGSQLAISQNDLFSLILSLQPDIVILPPGFSAYLARQHLSFPQTITAYKPAQEISDAEKSGIYLSYEKTESFVDFFRQFQQYKARPI